MYSALYGNAHHGVTTCDVDGMIQNIQKLKISRTELHFFHGIKNS